ncbi:NAD(P)/FAD-dependent oxidoreductase [Pseudomonas sp. PDM14]|uniref:flavin-containing monooxygenase n=1 Tax=Pseudomonas sp. PDM14 TaxID=2769288 RepID=UPI001781C5D0|nr:NAD(P)/FAD-dependent oxidoreductase [Pseudomonas sp. PDM14]MBD9482570.1 NAD(P)/FAD-dependent oxidoreductase [Pseudomonas sp. PDM14]
MPATSDAEFLDVLIVGAGLSGICAAHKLQQRCPDKRYAILETRAAIGGTWDLFRYPGIRSDSDMYTLSYGFKPWLGQKAIADGADIKRYIEEAADEGGVTAHIRFGHRVVRAAWSSPHSCWTVTAEVTDSNGATREVELRARLLYLGSGYYNYSEAYRPDFPGEEHFAGTIVHPQFWPQDLDYSGKRVVVIGSGATAVTLVPAMARHTAHITMLQRSPSYVAALPAHDAIAHSLLRWLPSRLAHRISRWKNVLIGMALFQLAKRKPELFTRKLLELAARRLGPDVDMRHFTPSYRPWDQRLCAVPDGDLFKALRAGRASVVTDTIERFTTDGIRLASGQELAADIIVTATGLKLNVLGDIRFQVDGEPLTVAEKMAYKGMMLSDVPNCIMAFGYVNSSWTLKAELTADYVCRLLRFMDRKGYATAVAKADASVGEVPFLSFNSGYVQRAAALLPKQGARRPWQVYQNYLQDMLTIRYSRIDDGVMHFKPLEKNR